MIFFSFKEQVISFLFQSHFFSLVGIAHKEKAIRRGAEAQINDQ